MKKLALGACLLLVPAGGALAQQRGADALQAAILREESERDDEAAARMYRALVEDAQADEAVRVGAFERLVRLHRRLGKFEAARASLRELAEGVGARATQVLASADNQDEELRRQAEAILRSAGFPSEALSNAVRLIGAQAVPAISSQALSDSVENLSGYLTLLLELDPEAKSGFWAELARAEVLRRRAVLSYMARRKFNGLGEAITRALLPFLNDPDEAVRADALRCTREILPLQRLIGFLRDRDSTVRASVFVDWSRLDREQIEAATGMLRQLLLDPDSEIGKRAAEVVFDSAKFLGAMSRPLAVPSLSELLLEVLGTTARYQWGSTLPMDPPDAHLAPQSAPEVVRAARAVEGIQNPDKVRRGLVAGYVRVSTKVWGPEDLPVVLELIDLERAWSGTSHDRLDIASAVSEWIARNLRSEHASRVAARLEQLVLTSERERIEGFEWPASAAPELKLSLDYVSRVLSARDSGNPTRPTSYLSITACARAGHELTDHALIDAAASSSRIHGWAVKEVVRAGVVRPRILEGLLLADPPKVDMAIRAELFAHVVKHGIDELISVLPKAYGADSGNQQHPGILLLLGPGEKYSIEERVRILDACLKQNRAAFWSHVTAAINSSGVKTAMPDDLVRWFVSMLQDAPRAEPRAQEAILNLVHRTSPALPLRRDAIMFGMRSGDAGLVGHALSLVVELDAAIEPLLRQSLEHDLGWVRRTAVWTVGRVLPARTAVEWLRPLVSDPEADVRGAVVALPPQLPDRAWIPLLLEMLRDSNQHIRDAAQASLERLQFYFDQVERWERWQKGTTLSAPNAAEALLKQAAPDQPKPKRLAAIASLGTLGVAETLPFLIEWTSDADAEIAAAARDAIAKINAK